jgi:hypothetical protein
MIWSVSCGKTIIVLVQPQGKPGEMKFLAPMEMHDLECVLWQGAVANFPCSIGIHTSITIIDPSSVSMVRYHFSRTLFSVGA